MSSANDVIPIIVIMLVGMVCLYQLYFLWNNHLIADTGSKSFPTYTLPEIRNFNGYGWGGSQNKQLIAAGMRKKLVIPVYAVGLYISDSKDRELKKCKSKCSNKLSTSASESIGSAIVLKFQMSVGTNKVVNAIVDALPGKSKTYKESLNKFQEILLSGLGKDGAKTGDVVEFVFKGSNEIGVGVRGNVIGWIKNSELRSKLMDIYAGSKSVAPDVPKLLKEKYNF